MGGREGERAGAASFRTDWRTTFREDCRDGIFQRGKRARKKHSNDVPQYFYQAIYGSKLPSSAPPPEGYGDRTLAHESGRETLKSVPRLQPAVGVALIAAGLALLAWVGWDYLTPAPYRYVAVGEGGAGAFPELGIGEGLTRVGAYEVRARNGGEAIAKCLVADDQTLLRWESLLAEPVLNLTGEIADLDVVGRAIRDHAPSGVVVFGWWDTGRQLALLSGLDAFTDDHLSLPLILPWPWRGQGAAVAEAEREFWRAGETSPEADDFLRFAETLLRDPAAGVAGLRDLAGARPAVLVLHALDAYKLGVLAPDRFGVGFKDFPDSGQTHGLIANVKNWLESEGYESYFVRRQGERAVRVYFLTDADSPRTLLSRLLPFNTSDPVSGVPGLSLVLQRGDYWVYELDG